MSQCMSQCLCIARLYAIQACACNCHQNDAVSTTTKSTESTSCRQSICHKGNDSTAGHSRACIRVKVLSPNKYINRLTKCFSLIICAKEMKITGHTSHFCHSTAKRQQSDRFQNLMFGCHASSLPLQKRNLQGQTAQ